MKKLLEYMADNHPRLTMALVYFFVLFILMFFCSLGFSQSEARNLWRVIEQKSGVYKPLTFIPMDAPAGSYNISGDKVYYSDATNNPGSVYAVAALANTLHGAVMTKPDVSGIHLLKPGKWQDISLSYTPKYVVNNYVNIPNSGWERTWMWWHHIPTEGTGGANFNRSWWIGMCLKYPQLAPKWKSGITDHTKPNILHPDFPRIVYEEWVLRGSPETCSLFEIDGRGFWWVLDSLPPPANLNPGEISRYYVTVNNGNAAYKTTERLANGRYRMFNITVNGKVTAYPLTENLTAALDSLNKTAFANGTRYNYIDYYVTAYKNIQAYFDSQGATHVRFNILGYSAYRVPTWKVMQTDLSRFNVYYTSPNPILWTTSDMLQDRRIWNHWKGTGAKMIWRPNLWFADRFYPLLTYQKTTAFMRLVEPDGLLITGYTPAAIPLLQGLNFYTTFRQSQGVRFQESVQEYLATMPSYFGDYYRQALKLSETRNWSDSALMTLPESVEREASLQYNRYKRKEISYDALVQWWEDVLIMFPGSGTIRRVQSAMGEKPAPED